MIGLLVNVFDAVASGALAVYHWRATVSLLVSFALAVFAFWIIPHSGLALLTAAAIFLVGLFVGFGLEWDARSD
ncbi:MAG: hypothetical protein AMXMBFR84_38420 [Candidatus Hydrogenedentota bacterium]